MEKNDEIKKAEEQAEDVRCEKERFQEQEVSDICNDHKKRGLYFKVKAEGLFLCCKFCDDFELDVYSCKAPLKHVAETHLNGGTQHAQWEKDRKELNKMQMKEKYGPKEKGFLYNPKPKGHLQKEKGGQQVIRGFFNSVRDEKDISTCHADTFTGEHKHKATMCGGYIPGAEDLEMQRLLATNEKFQYFSCCDLMSNVVLEARGLKHYFTRSFRSSKCQVKIMCLYTLLFNIYF
jgi:hypothetical protein